MTDLQCPLCEAVLQFPSGRQDARVFLDVLSSHFSDACPAVRVMAAPPQQKPPQHHRETT